MGKFLIIFGKVSIYSATNNLKGTTMKTVHSINVPVRRNGSRSQEKYAKSDDDALRAATGQRQ